MARLAEVRDLGILVQVPSDAVAHERAHDAEAMGLDVPLHGVGHVAEALPGPALNDGQLEALPRDLEQLLDARRDLADRHRERAVGVIPLDDTPEVQPDDVPLLQAAVRRGNAVNDLLVDRDAHGGREAPVALEGGLGAAVHDEGLHFLVDLQRGQAGLHEAAQHLHDVGEDLAAPAHQVDLAARLEDDHPATAFLMAAWIASILPSPATVVSVPRLR